MIGNQQEIARHSGKVTATFLFTDVEKSTQLWESYPNEMPAALARHDSLAEEIILRHGGRLVKSRGEGDSLFAVFYQASKAVRAACDLQIAFTREIWPTADPLKVRIAIHTGEAQGRGDDYYGPAVIRCARLRGIAHGGQILMSESTFSLCDDDVLDEIEILALGSHRLKDLQQPEKVWQLCHSQLPSSFPALLSLNPSLNNLPQQITSFIGREKELQDICQKMSTARLVTLTGSGGVGKTRIAIQTAANMQEIFQDGVWFVELAAISDEKLVPHAIASALDVREEAGKPIVSTLVESLSSKSLLLVLDNCEHLLSSCAHIVNTLLRSCTDIHILVSSRETLGIMGEVICRIPSLSLPPIRHKVNESAALEYEAVRLFVERAISSAPSFTITESNYSSIINICRHLDGIPLALELAAVRVRFLPLEQIAARLTDIFRLLTGGSRAALPRHQTLKATIDWSYNLLTVQEQRILSTLSVFAGGWNLDAAETICVDDGVESWEVVDLLTQLVDKSLVVYDEEPGRYRLLETVRQYASERLQLSSPSSLMDAHADYYLKQAQIWSEMLEKFEEADKAIHALHRELDNLRAGMDRSIQSENHKVVTAYGLALARFFLASGLYEEGDRRLSLAAEAARRNQSQRDLAFLLLQQGRIAWECADMNRVRTLSEESYRISQLLEDTPRLIAPLINLGNVSWAESDLDEAGRRYEEGLELARTLSLPRYEGVLLGNLALIRGDQGEFELALQYFEESALLNRKNNNLRGYAEAMMNSASVLGHQKRYELALSRLQESLSHFEALGLQHAQALANARIADAYISKEDIDSAAIHLQEAKRISKEINDPWVASTSYTIEGQIAALQGENERANSCFREALSIILLHKLEGRRGIARLFQAAAESFEKTNSLECACKMITISLREYGDMKLYERQEALNLREAIRYRLGAENASRIEEYSSRISLEEGLA